MSARKGTSLGLVTGRFEGLVWTTRQARNWETVPRNLNFKRHDDGSLSLRVFRKDGHLESTLMLELTLPAPAGDQMMTALGAEAA
jgi:hypothetical protein